MDCVGTGTNLLAVEIKNLGGGKILAPYRAKISSSSRQYCLRVEGITPPRRGDIISVRYEDYLGIDRKLPPLRTVPLSVPRQRVPPRMRSLHSDSTGFYRGWDLSEPTRAGSSPTTPSTLKSSLAPPAQWVHHPTRRTANGPNAATTRRTADQSASTCRQCPPARLHLCGFVSEVSIDPRPKRSHHVFDRFTHALLIEVMR